MTALTDIKYSCKLVSYIIPTYVWSVKYSTTGVLDWRELHRTIRELRARFVAVVAPLLHQLTTHHHHKFRIVESDEYMD
jgi:hypothetical protein